MTHHSTFLTRQLSMHTHMASLGVHSAPCLQSLLASRLTRLLRAEGCRQHRLSVKRNVSAQAKKKGGGKKKGPGSLMDLPKPAEPYLEAEVIMQNLLMVESYKRKVGRAIMEDAEISEIAKLLWEAPYAVLSHDLQEEPVKFDYANKVALDLFEAKWDELVGQPSAVSTEDMDQRREDREELLSQVKEHGTAPVHSAWRIGVKGRRFCINNGILWNIETPTGEEQQTGKLIGQAVAIHEWEFEDGTRGGPIADADAAAVASRKQSTQPPADEADINQAELSVQQQADHVRHLKEVDGLTKGDPVLDEAISELLQRKAALQNLE